MVTIKKILCPVDFFRASEQAVNYAVGLGANYDAKLFLLHVVNPVVLTSYEFPMNTDEVLKAMEEQSVRKMKKLAAKAKTAKVAVETDVRTGDVDKEIKRALLLQKPDLIVMGTHGRRGVERWMMGSVTERVLRHCPVPLLTVSGAKRAAGKSGSIRNIVVTTDFSEGTADALAYAFSIAQENQARVTLLHVIHDLTAELSVKYREPLLNGVRQSLAKLVPEGASDWCDIVTKVETGVPYQVILKWLKKDKADLLVVNIHGKNMLDRALLGSTAERLVRGAPCPVILVPPMKPAERKTGVVKRRAPIVSRTSRVNLVVPGW